NIDTIAERAVYPAPRSLNVAPDKATSHDGSKIAYYKQNKIYISDKSGGDPLVIVGGHFIVSPSEGSTIAWSPNDKYVAFCGQTVGGQFWPTYNLYIVPVNKKNQIKTLCYNIDYIFYWK
ncbi:MAG TPA: hypothetical protein VMF29_09260, partial [Candidatus Edwardsbacteria bacterium]|nr:hypothetical protein [Candidatus Edwardsbacteria bacterium]